MEDKTFTQEQVNEIIAERIIRAKESTRKEYDGFIAPDDVAIKVNEATQELNDKLSSTEAELTELKTQLANKQAEIDKYATDAVKNRIASEYGLSQGVTEFLDGKDEEAIRASAEKLKALFVTPPPAASREEPITDTHTQALKDVLKQIKQ